MLVIFGREVIYAKHADNDGCNPFGNGPDQG